jgi:hypothetical protein
MPKNCRVVAWNGTDPKLVENHDKVTGVTRAFWPWTLLTTQSQMTVDNRSAKSRPIQWITYVQTSCAATHKGDSSVRVITKSVASAVLLFFREL